MGLQETHWNQRFVMFQDLGFFMVLYFGRWILPVGDPVICIRTAVARADFEDRPNCLLNSLSQRSNHFYWYGSVSRRSYKYSRLHIVIFCWFGWGETVLGTFSWSQHPSSPMLVRTTGFRGPLVESREVCLSFRAVFHYARHQPGWAWEA